MNGKCEKWPFGHSISPSPGTKLEIDVAAPETAVTKSNPLNDNNAAIKKNINI